MTEELMTPKQLLAKSLIDHPPLYAFKNKRDAKFALYDQIFNVLGSGYKSKQDFFDNFVSKEGESNNINYDIDKFFASETPLYFTYSKLDPMFKSFGVEAGLSESFIGLLSKDEIEARDDIAATHAGVRKDAPKTPYPNFKKEYSILHKEDDLSFLSNDWLKEAKWFYKECKNFFKSDRVYEYHYYFPREEETKKWEKTINNYEKAFERMKEPDDSVETYHQKISDAYGLEYKGDTKAFIKERGYESVREALDFIDETLEKIDSELSLRQSKRNKRKP